MSHYDESPYNLGVNQYARHGMHMFVRTDTMLFARYLSTQAEPHNTWWIFNRATDRWHHVEDPMIQMMLQRQWDELEVKP